VKIYTAKRQAYHNSNSLNEKECDEGTNDDNSIENIPQVTTVRSGMKYYS